MCVGYFWLLDLSSAGAEVGEIVWEMQAKEFFYHIGMLVLEGRMPQLSDKGRVEGPHCLPLSGHIGHVCNLNQNKNVGSTLMHNVQVKNSS